VTRPASATRRTPTPHAITKGSKSHLTRIADRLQIASDDLVERRSFRAGNLDDTVSRRRERPLGNDGSNVVRRDWLEQAGRQPDNEPHVTYELDASGDLFWTRMKSNSRLEQFKALAYDAFREARFKFRLCHECKRPFVPVRRQAYCSAGCSQAVRTRKWRKAHPEKNRAIRRQQYQRSKAAELGLSERASIKIAKPRRPSPK
jgi:hypothetical protein